MVIQASGGNAIDAAAKRNGRIFVAYIVILITTALLVAVFTWLTWDAGNKVQEAIREDSTARIKEAERGLEQLRHENLALSAQVANLQGDAAKQQERAAVAERSLLELRQRLADRVISPAQREKMLAILRRNPSGRVAVQSLVSEGREGLQYGDAIAAVFRDAAWTVTDPNGRGAFSRPIRGVFLVVSPDMESSDSLNVVIEALIGGGVAEQPVVISPDTRRGDGVLEIWVGSK